MNQLHFGITQIAVWFPSATNANEPSQESIVVRQLWKQTNSKN